MADGSVYTLVNALKKAALAAVEQAAPADIVFGTVASTQPLVIRVEQKMELTQPFLQLTGAVMDVPVQAVINGTQQTVTLCNALAPGERVLLLRAQGGQQFIVLDRVRE